MKELSQHTLADGSVLLVEIFAGTLTRVSPGGTKTIVARPGGGPNGAALGPDGKCTFATTAASDGTSRGRTDGR